MIAREPDTKTRILDTAEKLFGENGFDATSLRDITAQADVNLAAVNYHFQSKDSLIDAVIARRIEPVNRRRLEMLEAAGPNPTIEQIVEAFLAPLTERDMGMVPMIGRAMGNPNLFLMRFFKRHFEEVSQRFREAFAKAAPELTSSERMWRITFMAGAMAHVLSWSNIIGEMSNGLCDPTDRKDVTARLVRFVAAGFRTPEVR